MEKLDDNRWLLPQTGGMRVPGMIYANDKIYQLLKGDESAKQVANVAHLPGIVSFSLAESEPVRVWVALAGLASVRAQALVQVVEWGQGASAKVPPTLESPTTARRCSTSICRQEANGRRSRRC